MMGKTSQCNVAVRIRGSLGGGDDDGYQQVIVKLVTVETAS